MNRAEKIEQLVKKVGNTVAIIQNRSWWFLKWTTCLGYLWIDSEETCWYVSLANGETTHQPVDSGPVIAADFRKDNGERKVGPGHLTGAWQSAITMHPIRDEKKAKKVFDRIARLVDHAYGYYCV